MKSSSKSRDEEYTHRRHGRRLPPPPPPQAPSSSSQQQQQQQRHLQPYNSNNNFSSRPRHDDNNQQVYRNTPPSSEQQRPHYHAAARSEHPDGSNLPSDPRNYPGCANPYNRREGNFSTTDFGDHLNSRFDNRNIECRDNNNIQNVPRNMPPSNSRPPRPIHGNYPQNYNNASGFIMPGQFPNMPPPPPPPPPPSAPSASPSSLNVVSSRLPAQLSQPQAPLPPPARDQVNLYPGVNYIPQKENVTAPNYLGNFNPLTFPLNTSCPPRLPSSLPPMPPPPSPLSHNNPSSVVPSPLSLQHLNPPPASKTDGSHGVTNIPPNHNNNNATSLIPPPALPASQPPPPPPPPPPLSSVTGTAPQQQPPLPPPQTTPIFDPYFTSPFPSPSIDPINTYQSHPASSSGFSGAALATSNFSVPPPLTPVYGSKVLPNAADQSETAKQSAIDDILQKQRLEDAEWIRQKCSSKIRERSSKPTSTITISEAQNLIHKMLTIAGQLHKYKKTLENIQETATEEEWLAEIRRIETTKDALEEIRKKITDENLVKELERRVNARLKKRARLKRLRKKKYEERESVAEHRKERHRILDDWREAISQKERQIKQDKEMKVAVDSVLGEVRKKKSDVSKMLELIGNLSKLRKIRKENVAKKGLYTLFHSDKKFEDEISGLQRMLNNQMDIYEAEQRTLMVMLECEQEETKERERAKSHKVQKEIDKREKKRELQLLFGKDTVDSSDPRYPFLKYYTQAVDNWESFLHIRREWDCYLAPETAPGACRIPDTWVLPPDPSSRVWAHFLES